MSYLIFIKREKIFSQDKRFYHLDEVSTLIRTSRLNQPCLRGYGRVKQFDVDFIKLFSFVLCRGVCLFSCKFHLSFEKEVPFI